MNSKFEGIISTPAMVVPAMTSEDIRTTLLEASVEYIKNNLSLETLILLATKIQYFMGMRGADSIQTSNLISQITELSKNYKNTDIFVDSISSTSNYSSVKATI
jgi:hypothetical protein